MARARHNRRLRAAAEAHARRRAVIGMVIAAVGVFAAVQIVREETAPAIRQAAPAAPAEISSIGAFSGYQPLAD